MRKSNSLKNAVTSIIPYILLMILMFFRIKIFLSSLGEEIYATNQLFTQIFAYISLIEGGVGLLIVQKYYKYFVNRSEKNINVIYTKSKMTMKKIAIVMSIIGIVVSLFLKLLTNNSLSLLYMQLLFLLYILRSVIEYLYISPRFVIQADQKLYKINTIFNIYKFIEICLEIGLLMLKVDYALILISTIIIRFISYKMANKKIFKEYPFLSEVKIEKNDLIGEIGDMFWHKISVTVKMNTDVILLSITQSPLVVSIYTSYNYIVKSITEIINLVATSILSSFGDAFYRENDAKSYSIFKKINIVFLFISAFVSAIFFIVADEFIAIWVGETYIFDNFSVIIISVILFQNISSKPLSMVYEALGLYKETKSIVAITAFINLALSVVLLRIYGVHGVLIATFISEIYLFVSLPRYIYKNVFKKKCTSYFLTYILVFSLTFCLTYAVYILSNKIGLGINIISFITYTVIVSLSVGIILFVIFAIISHDFRKFVGEMCDMIKKRKGK